MLKRKKVLTRIEKNDIFSKKYDGLYFAILKKSIANDEYDIFDCCAGNDMEGLKILIQSGKDLNVTSDNGYTPLHYAACYNSKECLELLLEIGADPNVTNDDGNTPLHYAARRKTEGCLQLLLEAGAKPNVTNDDGYTPLHYAVYYRNSVELVKLLLEIGADPNIKNDDGETPLDLLHDKNLKKEIEDHIQSISSLDIKEPSC